MYRLLSFLYRWKLICINKWISYTYTKCILYYTIWLKRIGFVYYNIRNDTYIYENDTMYE
jgi:hypothetical protein